MSGRTTGVNTRQRWLVIGVLALAGIVFTTSASSPHGAPVTTASAAAARLDGPPPFAPTSPFNRTLPRRIRAARNGQGLGSVARSVNYAEYSPIVYTTTPDGVDLTIRLKEQGNWGDNPVDGRVVRLPPGVTGAVDADGHVTIVAPSLDLVISLYQAEPAPRADGTWWATWGGSGPLSGDGSNFSNSKGGRESGISQLAGLITPADVRRGIADGPDGDLGHALSIGFPVVDRSVFVPPATRPGGGDSSSPADLYMGQKIYLRRSIDVNRLSFRVPWLSSAKSVRFSRLIARTLQRYGAIVVTNSPALSFQMVNPRSFTSIGLANPWPGLVGPDSGGYYAFTIRSLPARGLRALQPARTSSAG